MKHLKVGSAVWIKNKKKIGIITQVGRDGKPQKVEIDGKEYNTVGLILKVVSLFRLILLGLKSIFGKNQ